jgi:hypothetical protein
MADYQPVTDNEWQWLTRRFVALERLPDMRALFDRSLPGSPYTARERARYRAEIFQDIRELIAPTEPYPNPYFELSWIRSVRDNPGLLNDIVENRRILWDAYFRPQEPAFNREQAQEQWEELTRPGRRNQDLVTITDEDLEHAE